MKLIPTNQMHTGQPLNKKELSEETGNNVKHIQFADPGAEGGVAAADSAISWHFVAG